MKYDSYLLPMRLQIKNGAYQIDGRELTIASMCDCALLAANGITWNCSSR